MTSHLRDRTLFLGPIVIHYDEKPNRHNLLQTKFVRITTVLLTNFLRNTNEFVGIVMAAGDFFVVYERFVRKGKQMRV